MSHFTSSSMNGPLARSASPTSHWTPHCLHPFTPWQTSGWSLYLMLVMKCGSKPVPVTFLKTVKRQFEGGRAPLGSHPRRASLAGGEAMVGAS